MKVVFLDVVHPYLKEALLKMHFECIDLTTTSNQKLPALLKDADGIVIRSRVKMDENLLKHAPNLRFIARSGAGMENIDLNYCTANNIQCFNAPEGNRNAVGEHALGMLLALFNNLNKGHQEILSGKWDREGNRGIELDGKTVGIIGYGNNGSAFAKKLSGFDVKVIAYDKYKSDYGDSFVQESSLEQLKNEADVISLHIPQNETSMYLIDSEFIQSVRKSFYLINLSRGKIVSTQALVEGLTSSKILGACLDVLEFEKASFENFFEQKEESIRLTFKKLIQHSNVLLSPHVGGWTHESYYLLSKVLADKIEYWHKKTPFK